MFYVADGKIYLTERDALLGVYREVSIVDGCPVVQSTGLSSKPKARMVLTLDEVRAKFGRNYPMVESSTKLKDED